MLQTLRRAMKDTVARVATRAQWPQTRAVGLMLLMQKLQNTPGFFLPHLS